MINLIYGQLCEHTADLSVLGGTCYPNSCSNLMVTFIDNVATGNVVVSYKQNHGNLNYCDQSALLSNTDKLTCCFGQSTYGPDVTFSLIGSCGGTLEVQQDHCTTSSGKITVNNLITGCTAACTPIQGSHGNSAGTVTCVLN